MGGRARRVDGAAFAAPWMLALVACAGGGAPEKPETSAWDPETGGSSSSGASISTSISTGDGDAEADADSGAADTSPPDLGQCSDDADCALPAGLCWNIAGACIDGSCMHTPAPAGNGCDDDDACTLDDVCDGAGGCIGDALDCVAPHASGGSCRDGMCGTPECDTGWGDCNVDWGDGCETPLTSSTDCGACGAPCQAGDHATADCTTGSCAAVCDDPWQDCDGDPANGCEIPVGVANQCDSGGLNSQSGCWTAWCGQSNAPEASNFGSWYCFECSTCHVPAGGMCQWCDHATGTWYPAEVCACGGYEDDVCAP